MDESAARRLLTLTGKVMMAVGRMKRVAYTNQTGDLHPGSEFAILETILHYECKTVPRIADFRGVSRQSVQRLVNNMLELGTLVYMDNPSHRSSKNLHITPRGLDLYRSVELKMLDRYIQQGVKLTEADLDAAERVLTVIAETWDLRDEANLDELSAARG